MKTLVIGATGATGKQLVEQLLNMEQKVKVIVRPSGNIPDSWKSNNNLSIIEATISKISVSEMGNYIQDCESVASCLGHNITVKGVFGKPKNLVSDAIRLLVDSIQKSSPEKPIRLVLMNTTAYRNRDLNENISLGEKIVMGLIRLLVPPQSDNEKAADLLRVDLGQNNKSIQWVSVRPDTLINEDSLSEYEIYTSPTRSALFNPGKTSRINVGHFMAKLLVDHDLWDKWRGQMPVIYNK